MLKKIKNYLNYIDLKAQQGSGDVMGGTIPLTVLST